ncbi:hypothetical protein BGZ98_002474 [Dissophora globulifera]|nr:hypothetical protein BGZ98_002474 [Dissophora globulifera]
MSDSSITDNDTILQLRLELAALRSFVTEQLPDGPPPNQIDAPRSRILVLSDDLKEVIPAIAGKDFFNEPADAADDTIFTEDVMFPKNPEQQYSAPAMELPWPDKAKTHQAFDKTLAKIQDRLAFITRPMDEFAVYAFSNIEDPGIRQAVFDYTQIVRSQMAITARQITRMRTDNYVWAKGLKPALDKSKGAAISKDDVTVHIKAAESFAAASAPPKSAQTSNNQFGRGKYTCSYRGGYFGRAQYQQQQFPQQQSQQHQSGYFPQVQAPLGYPNYGYEDNYQGHQGQYFQRGRRGRGRGQAQKHQ